ncbi:MAG: hypothetical protein DRJ52_02535 [Thermoprotei archaeon]|nr:MAG: hypothetical protein DRJ52_02535 [Thermoprotei archaeon]
MKNDRAVSEVVSFVLMLVITVVISLIIYLWYTGYLSNVESAVNRLLLEEELSLRERFKIIHVSVSKNSDSSTLNISIYVYNYGDILVTISTVYINDTLVNLLPAYKLMPGRVAVIKVSFTSTVSSSSLIRIRVVSRRGNYAEYSVRSP